MLLASVYFLLCFFILLFIFIAVFVEALFLRIKRKGIYSQVEFHCRHNETRSLSLGVKNGSVGTDVLIASEDIVGNERARRP